MAAGIGVLVSDATGSKDLIEASGAGAIVPAGNPADWTAAIRNVIENPALVEEWKEQARAFRDQIAATNVGDYLTTVLRLAFCREGARPLAPWAKHTATDAVSANDHDRDGTVKI